MNILGLEASTRRASIAVVRSGGAPAETVLPDDRSASAQLVPALDGLLKKCGLAAGDLDGIAVGIGPGSFTGIRICLATARGFSAARGTPIRGVCGFDALVAEYFEPAGAREDGIPSPPFSPGGGGAGSERGAARLCVVADAHSHGLYAAVYVRDGGKYRRAQEPFVCRPDALPGRIEGEVFFLGPHLDRFREPLAKLFAGRASFDTENRFPSATAAALLFESPSAVRDDPPGAVAPLYLLPGVRVKPAGGRA